jgi:hypothetical protein
MRSTVTEHASNGRGRNPAQDEQDFPRDNPRRRREPLEHEDDDRRSMGSDRIEPHR